MDKDKKIRSATQIRIKKQFLKIFSPFFNNIYIQMKMIMNRRNMKKN